MNKADANQLGYVGKVPGSRDSNAWFTPPKYVKMVTEVLGGIDLDPFSCAEANKVVKAKRIFTERDSAFEGYWAEDFLSPVSVFMNPPYGRGIMEKAIEKFRSAYRQGDITEAVVLVNGSTETKWFQAMVVDCSAMCLVAGRISFYNTDGKAVSGNTKGQVFFYFGNGVAKFKDVFSPEGVVLCR
jgi:ParB family chromosome partitioning protein